MAAEGLAEAIENGELPESISVGQLEIPKNVYVGVGEVLLGVGMMRQGYRKVQRSAGFQSVDAGRQFVLGIQFIGIGVGTVAGGEVISPMEILMPPEGNVRNLR